MKKTLSVLAVLGIIAVAGNQCANAAFQWSDLNPFTWFGNSRCNKCETPKNDCGCKPLYNNPCPCTTGAAAPCDPCQTQQAQPCDACDRLQQHMQNR